MDKRRWPIALTARGRGRSRSHGTSREDGAASPRVTSREYGSSSRGTSRGDGASSRLGTSRRAWPVVAALVVAVAGFAFWRCLPRPLFHESLASILLARDGSLLSARIAADGQWRFPPLERVPRKYETALLAYEDKRFEHHIGVDPVAIARAIRSNLRAGRTVSGASTLTMQLARLVRAGGTNGQGMDRRRHRGYADKLLEMFLALRIESA